jgi:ADP-heptose:LPS heptosyltransferase
MLNTRNTKAFILRLIASKKSINFDIKAAKKVLFLRYDRIGDMVITTPVFRELKQAYPDINVTVLASKINKDILLNNPYVDKIIINNKRNFFGDLLTLFKLRREKYDACIEFDHSVIPHAIIRLKIINPKKVISVKKDGRYGVDGSELSFYDFYTEKPKKNHFRDIWLGTLKPFDIRANKNNYDLFIPDEFEYQAKNFLNQFASKFLIGINLEGAARGKKININELYEICKALYKNDKNIQIIILSTPKNYQSTNKKIIKMSLNYVVMGYKTNNILMVGALIKQLDFIITPDTSIVHIASTFNKPIVTIHENNQDSYQLFAPISDLNKTVFSKSIDSLRGFSLDLLFSYCVDLINIIKKEDYGK